MPDDAATITCPECNYGNQPGAAACGMCGYVPPRTRASQEMAIAAPSIITTSAPTFRRPSVEAERRARAKTDRVETTETERVVRTERKPPTVATACLPVTVPAEIAHLRKQERLKQRLSTVMSVGRMTRRALVGFLVLLVICGAREGLFAATSFATAWTTSEAASTIFFCAVFGLPVGFIVGWHGGGAYRGLTVAGLLFAFEPFVISALTGTATAWAFKELFVGLVAGFCVGLFIEIDS